MFKYYKRSLKGESIYSVGDYVTLRYDVINGNGIFTRGTKVRIRGKSGIGLSQGYSYTIEDNFGNIACGVNESLFKVCKRFIFKRSKSA